MGIGCDGCSLNMSELKGAVATIKKRNIYQRASSTVYKSSAQPRCLSQMQSYKCEKLTWYY